MERSSGALFGRLHIYVYIFISISIDYLTTACTYVRAYVLLHIFCCCCCRYTRVHACVVLNYRVLGVLCAACIPMVAADDPFCLGPPNVHSKIMKRSACRCHHPMVPPTLPPGSWGSPRQWHAARRTLLRVLESRLDHEGSRLATAPDTRSGIRSRLFLQIFRARKRIPLPI